MVWCSRFCHRDTPAKAAGTARPPSPLDSSRCLCSLLVDTVKAKLLLLPLVPNKGPGQAVGPHIHTCWFSHTTLVLLYTEHIYMYTPKYRFQFRVGLLCWFFHNFLFIKNIYEIILFKFRRFLTVPTFVTIYRRNGSLTGPSFLLS